MLFPCIQKKKSVKKNNNMQYYFCFNEYKRIYEVFHKGCFKPLVNQFANLIKNDKIYKNNNHLM